MSGGQQSTTGSSGTSFVQLRLGDLLGKLGGSGMRFLSGLGQQAGGDLVVQAGNQPQSFDLANGGHIDLTKILASAPLAHDLGNIASFVKLLGGKGSGNATLEIDGPSGSATVKLHHAAGINLKDLLASNTLILPPH
ncbi:MAG: hypothetical protein U1E53_06330 [Dongiaceae bacterium]